MSLSILLFPLSMSAQYEIDSTVVRPRGYAESMVRKAAENFARDYRKDYVSLMTYTQTTECNGKYRSLHEWCGMFLSFEFNQQKKVSVKDDNYQLFMPFNALRSYLWHESRDEELESYHVSVPERRPFEEELALSYYASNPHYYLLDAKRTIEIYGPLNPKNIRQFEYTLSGEGPDGTVEIKFKSKDGYFPRRSRLYGAGILWIDTSDGTARKIVMDDYIDLHAIALYYMPKEIPQPCTSHEMAIVYAREEGHLYTKSLIFSEKWDNPDAIDPMSIMPNVRRRPFKNALNVSFRCEFSDFRNLDEELIETIGHIPYSATLTMYAPCDVEWWESHRVPWIDWDKVEKDLDIGGVSLWEQGTRPVRFNDTGIYDETIRPLDYDKEEADIMSRSRKIFQTLYSPEYDRWKEMIDRQWKEL